VEKNYAFYGQIAIFGGLIRRALTLSGKKMGNLAIAQNRRRV
jgi:hypothetical protein